MNSTDDIYVGDILTTRLCRPCPTDRYIIEIKKEFISLKKEMVDIWVKGVANHLLAQRDYIDLKDCRMSIKRNKNAIVPIISLKPIIGFDNEDTLLLYIKFFDVYTKYRNILIGMFDAPSVKPGYTVNPMVLLTTNIIKIMIHAMSTGSMTMDILDTISKVNVFDESDAGLEELAHIVRNDLKIEYLIGYNFQAGGSLDQDIDDNLHNAFSRYVNKYKEHIRKLVSDREDMSDAGV